METLQFPQWDTDLEPARCRAQLLDQLEIWIGSSTLSELASQWAHTPHQDVSPTRLFDWYDEFSSQHWDYRAGRERNLAASAGLTSSQQRAAMEAAEAMGLLRSRPPRRSHYDYMIILGGLIRACITRPRYARELMDSGLTFDVVVALGGFRPLAGDELALAKRLSVAAGNEFEAMIAGLKAAFPSLGDEEIETSTPAAAGNADWAIARFGAEPITVVAAPSRDPEHRRANTGDTFAWWAENIKDLDGKHILLVTNPIYVPYQGAAAIEALGMPFHLTVDTVGISSSAADLQEDTQRFEASNYLQEIRSTIRGYKSLYRAVSAMTDSSSDVSWRYGTE